MSHVGILVFDGVEELDFAGPLEVFGVARELGAPLELFIVALEKRPITCAHGLKVVPHYDAASCPPIDVLVVPGGEGRRREMKNPRMLERLREWAAGCRLVASVCTGSLLLAAAGLLQGKRATTHWSALEELRGFPDVTVEQRRYIHEGNLISAAGVASGMDMALYVVEMLFGAEVAKAVARQMEYQPATRGDTEEGGMNKKEEETIRYYEKELGWVPPFVKILAKYSPGALYGYLTMRKEVLKEPPEGALPSKIKEMLFSILDSVTGEVNGAKAHAKAAVDAGLTMEELVEGFVIAIMVTGITTMCKAGVEAINAAEERFKEKEEGFKC